MSSPSRGDQDSRWWGHSANTGGQFELLRDHLQAVAQRVRGYAGALGCAELARIAGLLHDLGKYAEQFQRRLRDPHEAGRDHWSAGVLEALCRFRDAAIPVALAIEGHHRGLQHWPADGWQVWANELAQQMANDTQRQFTSGDLLQLRARMVADGITLPARLTEAVTWTRQHRAALMLEVRMLFSALVDADFLETEAHFSGDAASPRRPRLDGPTLDAARSLSAVMSHIEHRRTTAPGAAGIQAARDQLLQDCLSAAEQPTGLFTLTAPTGSGKTLALLAFAVAHAQRHGLRRVVTVMPFLNIIDQTAQVYREVFDSAAGFPTEYVLEDHSQADTPNGEQERTADAEPVDWPDADDVALRRRLLSQNWDAPLVLTTHVQCLESLHASRPRPCRKLHRLAQSVILFDEVQTLPTDLAVVTLATLSHLAARYDSTIVFATATQPAFETLSQQVARLAPSGWAPRPIVRNLPQLYQPAAQRVRVRWRHEQPISWDELADELAGLAQPQFLTIVNLKRHAQALLQALQQRGQEHLYHLSTSLCPAHRSRIIAEVVSRVREGLPVRLVATQCVEAGVDLDFPVVYRALAPLESIAQAAGRCNRHGRRAAVGQVRVFVPEGNPKQLYPGASYGQAADIARQMLTQWALEQELEETEILCDPQRLQAYFRRLYAITDPAGQGRETQRKLRAALEGGDFAALANAYQLITGDMVSVLMPYVPAEFDRLRQQIEQAERFTPELIRQWVKAARPHAVSIHRPQSSPHRKADPSIAHLCPVQFSHRPDRQVDIADADWFICCDLQAYDRKLLGYQPAQEMSFIA